MKNRYEILYDSKKKKKFIRGVICIHKEKVNLFTVLFQMGVERCIHRYLHFALKVHQIDAFNFNIKSSQGSMPPDPPRGG